MQREKEIMFPRESKVEVSHDEVKLYYIEIRKH